jgi:hypothetical protein
MFRNDWYLFCDLFLFLSLFLDTILKRFYGFSVSFFVFSFTIAIRKFHMMLSFLSPTPPFPPHSLPPQASIRSLEASIRSVIVQPLNSLPFLNAGRMVHVKDGDVDWGWGIITGFQVCSGSELSLVALCWGWMCI